MQVRIGGYLDNSLANGEGLRTVIFMAGCNHGCRGCHNEHLWPLDSGIEVDIEEVFKRIDKNLPLIKGITISGGEPFLQSEATLEIIKHAKSKDLNIWIYTGFEIRELRNKGVIYTEILDNIDVLVDGKFVEELREGTLRYTGSRNQRIIRLKG